MLQGGKISGTVSRFVLRISEQAAGFTLNIAPYDQLRHAALVAELHLLDQQKTKVQEIVKSLRFALRKFNDETQGLSTDEKKSARSRWEDQQRKVIQEQLEKALVPEQMQTLNRLTLSLAAYDRMRWSEYRETLGLTKEQQDQMQLVDDEYKSWPEQNAGNRR